MIPELPKGMESDDMLDFYEKYAARLDGQSGVHVMWHTHKRDPSVCWICDTQILTYKVLEICKDIIQSRSLDMETELEIDSEFESEINSQEERDVEHPDDDEIAKGYNEPEFEVDEDGYRNKGEIS